MEQRPHTIDPARAEFLGRGPIPRSGKELLRRYVAQFPDGVLKELLSLPGVASADVDFDGPNVCRARLRARITDERVLDYLRDGLQVGETGAEVEAATPAPVPPTDAVLVTEATIRDAELEAGIEGKGPIEIRGSLLRGSGRWALSPDGDLWVALDDAPARFEARVDPATVADLFERAAELVRASLRGPARWARTRRVTLNAQSRRRGELRLQGAATVRWLLLAMRVRAELRCKIMRGGVLRTRVRLSSRNPFVGIPLLFLRIEQPDDIFLAEAGIELLEFRVRRGVVEVQGRTTGKEAP